MIVVHLSTSGHGTFNCSVRLKSQLQSKATAQGSGIVLSGKAPSNSVPNYLHDDHPISYSEEPGKGMNFAAVLTREVFYRSFDNRRQIASYVGITPIPYQSGGMDRDRRISRAGNPRARTTMIQLAWLWLRYQPGSELAEWFRERVGTLAGRTRRIAIVAMARKLLIALWRYAETGVIPAGAEIRAETTVAA